MVAVVTEAPSASANEAAQAWIEGLQESYGEAATRDIRGAWNALVAAAGDAALAEGEPAVERALGTARTLTRLFLDPAAIRAALLLPLAKRKALVGGARRMSVRETQTKVMSIMDVNQAAVEEALRKSGCGRLIHGHTHRPGQHEHMVDGRRCQRWVLSDWYTRGQYLRVGPGSCEPIELPFA